MQPTTSPMFLRCTLAGTGIELFVWLTQAQMYAVDARVVAYQEINGGEMVERDVRIADLENFEEV